MSRENQESVNSVGQPLLGANDANNLKRADVYGSSVAKKDPLDDESSSDSQVRQQGSADDQEEQASFTQNLKAFFVNYGGELAKFAVTPFFAAFASVIYIQATKNGTLAQQISGPGINFLVNLQAAFKSAHLVLEKLALGKKRSE